MKSIMFIDRDTHLARAVRSLADILHIPFELIARSNDARRILAMGNVGLIIANSEITTIRFEDLAIEMDTIIKRNRIPDVPIYYICADTPVAGENLPIDVPPAFLIKRGSGLENIYRIIEHTLLTDEEIEQSGGFVLYTEEHKAFIDQYLRVISDLEKIVAKALS